MGNAVVGSLGLGSTLWVDAVWAVVASLALSSAAWLSYWFCKRALEAGLSADRWSDDARTAVKNRIVRIARWLAPIWISILIIHFVRIWGYRHGHATPMLWVPIWMFSQATTTIRQMIGPSAPTFRQASTFANVKPIKSEHWGERMTQG